MPGILFPRRPQIVDHLLLGRLGDVAGHLLKDGVETLLPAFHAVFAVKMRKENAVHRLPQMLGVGD